MAEEFPQYTTPIDELVAKCEAQGLKVAFGDHPENGIFYVLPFNSDDIDMDNLFPRHLRITEAMDARLRKLILMNIEMKEASN